MIVHYAQQHRGVEGLQYVAFFQLLLITYRWLDW